MSSKKLLGAVALAAAGLLAPAGARASITIPTVPVGNIGNAPDSSGFGSVAYLYNIGTTEVTNAQYTAFLNAVGANDTNALYNTNMAGAFGGINRAGPSGSYVYSTVSGRENNPVNFVSLWDAMRFANWLHNGQPTGPQSTATTEDGAYTLLPGAITANTVTRNPGWQWAVVSGDEWYKAAYHQPAGQGGDTDDYWLYPTSSNSAPSAAQANYLPAGINNTTPAGSYAPNFYGTYDMAGNVYEWNDSLPIPGPFRGYFWGGAFDNIAGWLTPLNGILSFPASEREQFGFRVVQIPAPSATALLALGGAWSVRRRRA